MDLNEAYQQIVAVLRNPEFLQRVTQLLEKERRVKQAEENRHDQSWALSDLPEFSLLAIDAEIIDREGALYSTFEDHAINRLPQPPLISANDLQEIALAQLGGMTDETKHLQLQRFIYQVLLKVNEHQSCTRQVDFGDWTRAGVNSENEYQDGPLWDDLEDGPIPIANGFVLDVELDKAGPVTVAAKGFIRGVCSASAAQRLSEQIGPMIESLVRSLKLAATYAELEPAREFLAHFDVDPDAI